MNICGTLRLLSSSLLPSLSFLTLLLLLLLFQRLCHCLSASSSRPRISLDLHVRCVETKTNTWYDETKTSWELVDSVPNRNTQRGSADVTGRSYPGNRGETQTEETYDTVQHTAGMSYGKVSTSFNQSPKCTLSCISALADWIIHSKEKAQRLSCFFSSLLFFSRNDDTIYARINEWTALDAIKAKVQWQLSVWITSKEPACSIYVPDAPRNTVHSLHCSSDTMLFKWREKEREKRLDGEKERKRINSSLVQPGGKKEVLTSNELKEGWIYCTSPLHLRLQYSSN